MKENRLTFGCALIYTICSKESGARIRQRRRQLGYRVEELSDALNVTTKSFYRWESGECSPSLDNLYALAVVLRTTMDDLLVGNRELVDSCTDWNVHRSGAAGGRSCNSDDSCGSSGQTFRAVLGLLQLLKIQKKMPAAFCSRRLFFTFIHKKNSYKKLLFHSAGVLKIRLIQNISNRMYTVYFYLYKYHILYSWKNQYV